MRLSSSQAKTIKDTVTRVVDSGARVWLFGSRLDDALRGGDIDLYVETDQVMPNRIETLCRLEGALIMGMGWVKDADGHLEIALVRRPRAGGDPENSTAWISASAGKTGFSMCPEVFIGVRKLRDQLIDAPDHPQTSASSFRRRPESRDIL